MINLISIAWGKWLLGEANKIDPDSVFKQVFTFSNIWFRKSQCWEKITKFWIKRCASLLSTLAIVDRQLTANRRFYHCLQCNKVSEHILGLERKKENGNLILDNGVKKNKFYLCFLLNIRSTQSPITMQGRVYWVRLLNWCKRRKEEQIITIDNRWSLLEKIRIVAIRSSIFSGNVPRSSSSREMVSMEYERNGDDSIVYWHGGF